MLPTFLLLLVFVSPFHVVARGLETTSHIIVTGTVYCDVCYNNAFTKQSFFLPGADVHVRCKFQANAPKTSEKFSFSVNRTTNRYGVYRVDIPSVEGVDCVEGPVIQSFCEASLIGSSVSRCNLTGVSATSKEITVKSRSTNLCVYSISALSYRPANRNSTLCGNYDSFNVDQEKKLLLPDSFNSSKFFLPCFPWPLPQFPPLPPLPPWPSLPPLPQLPPFPSFPPLPPFPSFPPSYEFPPLSPLPPLPKLPPLPPFESALPPPLPPLNFPPFSRQPGFNPGDPRTWTPRNPFPIPTPPQGLDPRTWIPTFPPFPNSPQSQQP